MTSVVQGCTARLAAVQHSDSPDLASQMAWLLSQLSLLPELASYAASQAQQHSSAGSQAALASLKAQVTEALTQREHAAVFELAVALVLRSFDASERTPAPASRNALVEELLVGVCAKHASALWLPAQLASLWPQAFLHAALHHTSSSDTTVTGHVALVMDFVASGNPKDVSDAIQASVANALQHADPSQLPVLCKWLGLACKAPLTVQAAAEGVVAAVRDWWSALSSSSAATSTAIAPPPEPHVVGSSPSEAVEKSLLQSLQALFAAFPAELGPPGVLLLIDMLRKAGDCASAPPAGAAGAADATGKDSPAGGSAHPAVQQWHSLVAAVRSGAAALLTSFADHLAAQVVPYHYAQLTGRASVPGPPARQQGAESQAAQDGSANSTASGQLHAAQDVLRALSLHIPALCMLTQGGSAAAPVTGAPQHSVLGLLGLLGLCGQKGAGAQILSCLFRQAVEGSGPALAALQYLGKAFVAGAHEAEVSSWAARCVAEPWADPTAALKTLARLAFGSGQAQSGSGPSASNGFAWTLKQALSASWGTVFRHVQEDTSADAAFDLLSRLLSSEANSSVALSYWDAEARAYQLLGFLLDLISRPEADVATMILRDRRVRQASALLQRMLASPRLLYLVVDVLVASGVLLALQRSAQQEGPRPKMLAQSLQALTPPVGLTANGRRVPARVLSLERDGGEGMSLLEQNRRPLRAPDGGEAQKRRRLDNGAAPEAFNPAIPLLAHHGAAHLASVKLRLVGLLHSVALAHEKGPEAVANNIQERLVDAFGAPPTRAMYHAHLPRAPPITWHVHVIEVLRLSEFLGAAIEGCGQRGGQEALLPVMPVVLAALADCIARYGAAAQAKGAMAADKADALWVLRVLKHTGWLPDVLLATGELFHALPNQDISSLLLIGWHIVASELDRLEGKVLPDQATGGAPLQGRNTSGPYNVNTNGGYGQASVASSAAAVIALERKWRGVILPLLHRHIAVVGPQYGRFVALLSEQ